MENWQKEMIWLTVVYRLAECKETIPLITEGTRFEFIEKILDEMHTKYLIKISQDKKHWVLADEGRKLLTRLVGMFDQAIRFEIFADVIIDQQLPDDITDDDGELLEHCFDPRFSSSDESEDMRIAMMTWFAESLRRKGEQIEFDSKRIIFLQMLAEGKLAEDAKDFWFGLRQGDLFREIQEIADAAYQWTDLSDTEEESFDIAQTIYTAGMIEQRKREGDICSGCKIPLAIFEAIAKENGEELLECPNPDCGASFESPEEEGGEYECPRCKGSIRLGQSTCYGCGAHVDFSLPSGSVQTETVEETEEEYDDDGYGYYYGYCPYGWYDPWNPYVSGAAFGLVCGAILF